MVEEAEKYKEEDERNAKIIESKGKLENYCYSLKNSVNDEKLADKIQEEDKKTIISKVEETLKWLDENQMNSAEEYDTKQKVLEEICSPIMQKIYQAGAQGMPGQGMPAGMTPEMMAEKMGQGVPIPEDNIEISEVD